MKRTLFFIYLFSSFCINSHAGIFKNLTISTGEYKSENSAGSFTRQIEYERDGVVVNYNFDKILSVGSAGSETIDLYYPSFNKIYDVGFPSIPERQDVFYIEKNSNIQFEILSSEFEEYELDIEINSGKSQFQSNQMYDSCDNDGYFPNEQLMISNIEYRRGMQLIYVMVSPVQYNQETHMARIYKSLSYRIRYQDPTDMELKTADEELNLIANPIRNARSKNKITNSYITSVPKGYLIITNDLFRACAEKLAEWKRLMGYKVIVESRDKWSVEDVKNTIEKYYKNESWFVFEKPLGDSTLEFVLFIGAPYYVSTNIKNAIFPGENQYISEWIYHTDLPYFCMDGDNDTTPDVYYGRLPVHTIDEATIVVDKIINYERIGSSQTNAFNNVITVAGFWDTEDESDGYEDSRFVETVEDIRQHILGETAESNYCYKYVGDYKPTNWTKAPDLYTHPIRGASLPDYMLDSSFDWDGNSDKLFNLLNRGASIVLARGHGGNGKWAKPDFTNQMSSKLTNGDKLPFIFSIYCQTGYLALDDVTRAMLTNPNGGSIGAIAASERTFSGYNDSFLYGMCHVMFPHRGIRPNFQYEYYSPDTKMFDQHNYQVRQTGVLMDLGILLMNSHYGSIQSNRYRTYTREVYHCLSDPSLQLYVGKMNKNNDIEVIRTENGVYASSMYNEYGYMTFYDSKSKNTVCLPSCTSYYYETENPEWVSVSFKLDNSPVKVNNGANVKFNYLKF